MNRTKIGLIFLVLFFILLGFLFFRSGSRWNGFAIRSYTLSGKAYTVLVADTPVKWTQGLMNVRQKPQGIDGMLFLFPDAQYRSFWNMNTYLPLKLLWIEKDTVVGKTDLPPITETKDVFTVTSPRSVDAVLELFKN